MQITKYSDYSIRVLIFLALNTERKVAMREIAEFFQISMEHLRKVVHNLAKLSYLDSYRGKGGGLLLNGKPEDINLGELMMILEKKDYIVDCHGKEQCQFAPNCRLESIFNLAEAAFYDKLKDFTLQNVVSSPDIQSRIFHIEAPLTSKKK